MFFFLFLLSNSLPPSSCFSLFVFVCQPSGFFATLWTLAGPLIDAHMKQKILFIRGKYDKGLSRFCRFSRSSRSSRLICFLSVHRL
jgi:hypothetical protein